MKKLHILLMSFISAISTAHAADEAINQPFYYTKSFFTQCDEKVELDIPLGLEINEEYFRESPKSDAPYILENTSIALFNEGKLKESALYTIASIWAGTKDYNFINELEDSNPGIVDKIRRMVSPDDFNFVIRALVGTSNENKVQAEKKIDNPGNKPREKEDNSSNRAFNAPTNNSFMFHDKINSIETY